MENCFWVLRNSGLQKKTIRHHFLLLHSAFLATPNSLRNEVIIIFFVHFLQQQASLPHPKHSEESKCLWWYSTSVPGRCCSPSTPTGPEFRMTRTAPCSNTEVAIGETLFWHLAWCRWPTLLFLSCIWHWLLYGIWQFFLQSLSSLHW